MSATSRGRHGRPIVLLAGLVVMTLASGTAWGFMRGAHGAGHVGGSAAGRHGGAAPSRGHFASGPFASHRFGEHRRPHARHDGRRFFPWIYAGDPYLYFYDEYEDDDAGHPGAHHSRGPGFCNVSPHFYPQDCVWKDHP
jgi:hypothetical protein